MALFNGRQIQKPNTRLFRPAGQDDPEGISPPMLTPGIPGIPSTDLGEMTPALEPPSLASELAPIPPPDVTSPDDHNFPGSQNTPQQVRRHRLFGAPSDQNATPSFENTPQQVQKVRMKGGAEATHPSDDEQVTYGNFPDSKNVSRETGEKKPNLVGRLFGYSDPSRQDELGLTMPQKEHKGILSTILQYALPAIFGATAGVGVLPGLMTATAQSGGEKNKYDKAMEEYDKQRASILTPSSNEKEFELLKGLPPNEKQLFLQNKAAGQLMGQPIEWAKMNMEQPKIESEIEKNKAETSKANERGVMQSITDAVFGGGSPKVLPKASPQGGADHNAALIWAKAHPKDPRAAQILQRLGQ